MTDTIHVGSYALKSRLLVGTGKYRDLDETGHAIEASGADIVTMAVRRTNLGQNPNEPNLLDVISPDRYTLLPNTAGQMTRFGLAGLRGSYWMATTLSNLKSSQSPGHCILMWSRH